MSNVTGGCPDLAQAIRIAHASGMVVMVDGAQGVVHFPPTCRRWISTSMPSPAISSTGQPVLARCTASRTAGANDAVARRRQNDYRSDVRRLQNAGCPYRLEAGTPNVAGVIGLSAALEWLAETDIVQAESWSRGWRRWRKKN
jgi:cysteine sulfinate desulfinase